MTEMRFYATGYNLNNRMYSIDSFIENFTSPNFTLYLPDNYIYPEPFYINTELAKELLSINVDYVTYTYLNKPRYAFISAIRANPIEEGYTVYLQEDIWATYGLKLSGLNCKLEGTLLRAHVNDWENGKATLEYCVEEPEEEILYDGLNFKKIDSNYADNSISFLYVLCQINNSSYQENYNPSFVQQIIISEQSEDGSKIRTEKFNQYALYFCAFYRSSGELCNYRSNDGVIHYQKEDSSASPKIYDLNVIAGVDRGEGVSAYGIVTMWVSDIPPKGYTISSNMLYEITPNTYHSEFVNEPLYFSNKAKLNFCKTLCLDGTKTFRTQPLFNNYSYYIKNTNTPVPLIFSEYLNSCILKTHTHIYNPIAIVVDNTPIYIDLFNYSLFSDYSFSINYSIDPLLQYMFIYQPDYSVKNCLATQVSVKIYSQIEPTQHNSYWTTLRALQSTAENENIKYSAVVGGISKIVGNTVGVSMGIVSGKPASIAGSAFNLIESGLLEPVNMENKIRQANNNIERNNSLINGGIQQTASLSASTYYGYQTGIYYIQGILTKTNADKINYQLHKYGYVTNLPLTDEYFTKHKRQKFNFLIAENTVCSGLPLEYCRDIEKMFNNGVTLWSGVPLDYEVINMPENAYGGT